MAVNIILAGERISAGELPKRHLDLWCAGEHQPLDYLGSNQWESARGLLIEYRSNSARLRAETCRCDLCFFDGPSMPIDGTAWIREVKQEHPRMPGRCYVYRLALPAKRICQVGKAENVANRFRGHVRKSVDKHRLGGGLWRLYDVLAADPTFVPQWEILDQVPSLGSRSAETVWRERLRHDGWQVTSDY